MIAHKADRAARIARFGRALSAWSRRTLAANSGRIAAKLGRPPFEEPKTSTAYRQRSTRHPFRKRALDPMAVRLSSLLSLSLLLLVVACTEPLPHASDDASVTSAPICTPQDVAPFEQGAPAWTLADLTACEAVCPGKDDACKARECPKHKDWVACTSDSFDHCVTTAQAPCRGDWELYLCCSLQCDENATDDALRSCITQRCEAELDDYIACADGVLESDAGGACLAEARDHCLVPEIGAVVGDADAGVVDASLSGSDAATGDVGVVGNL